MLKVQVVTITNTGKRNEASCVTNRHLTHTNCARVFIVDGNFEENLDTNLDLTGIDAKNATLGLTAGIEPAALTKPSCRGINHKFLYSKMIPVFRYMGKYQDFGHLVR